MKKKIVTILLALVAVVGYAQTKKTPPEGYNPDRVVEFAFVAGDDVFMLDLKRNRDMLIRAMDFIDANRKFIDDGTMPIFVYGYCGNGGTHNTRKGRVKRMSNYVKGELIRRKKAKEDHFITSNSLGMYVDTLPNAVVLKFYLPFDYEARRPIFTEKPNLVPEIPGLESAKETVVVVPCDTVKAVAVEPQPVQPATAEQKSEEPVVVEPFVEPATEKTGPKSHLRWYAGVEFGIPVGISSFTSFAPKGGAGFEGGVLGGYRFTPMVSLEFGATFGTMELGSNNCCADYFLGADGERYLQRVAGMDSYSYRDVYSLVFVQQYSFRLNVDLLQIANPDWSKRWSLTLSPAIYGVATKAALKTTGTTIVRRDGRFQLGLGVGVGGGYQITQNLGVALRTGVVWVYGQGIDGVQPSDHKTNMIWNNALTLTWRFDGKK